MLTDRPISKLLIVQTNIVLNKNQNNVSIWKSSEIYCTALYNIWADEGGIFKSFLRVLIPCMWLLQGLGICLTVIFQTWAVTILSGNVLACFCYLSPHLSKLFVGVFPKISLFVVFNIYFNKTKDKNLIMVINNQSMHGSHNPKSHRGNTMHFNCTIYSKQIGLSFLICMRE